MSEYICQCGCNQPIPPKRNHKYRPPKYILEHFLKLKDSTRVQRSREARNAMRTEPPPDWIAPTGFCECGCKSPTPIAKRSHLKSGQYVGYPLRYLRGHSPTICSKGATHPKWKGGRYEHRGYVYIYVPDHPHANQDGYVFEHRLVYEQTHGVVLSRHQLVHHKNEVRNDNRPENLELTSNSAHSRQHDALGEWRRTEPDKALEHAKAAGLKGANSQWHK